MAGSDGRSNEGNRGGKIWHEVVDPPNRLARKVGKTGGVEPEKAFRDAEKIISDLAEEYVGKLAEDIDEVERLGERFREDRDPASLDRLFSLIHNMRGQGTTFGYPLITEIGRNFCRYVRERPEGVPISPDVVDHHVNALKVVYRQSIQGEGDETAQAVVSGLTALVSRELKPR